MPEDFDWLSFAAVRAEWAAMGDERETMPIVPMVSTRASAYENLQRLADYDFNLSPPDFEPPGAFEQRVMNLVQPTLWVPPEPVIANPPVFDWDNAAMTFNVQNLEPVEQHYRPPAIGNWRDWVEASKPVAGDMIDAIDANDDHEAHILGMWGARTDGDMAGGGGFASIGKQVGIGVLAEVAADGVVWAAGKLWNEFKKWKPKKVWPPGPRHPDPRMIRMAGRQGGPAAMTFDD